MVLELRIRQLMKSTLLEVQLVTTAFSSRQAKIILKHSPKRSLLDLKDLALEVKLLTLTSRLQPGPTLDLLNKLQQQLQSPIISGSSQRKQRKRLKRNLSLKKIQRVILKTSSREKLRKILVVKTSGLIKQLISLRRRVCQSFSRKLTLLMTRTSLSIWVFKPHLKKEARVKQKYP